MDEEELVYRLDVSAKLKELEERMDTLDDRIGKWMRKEKEKKTESHWVLRGIGSYGSQPVYGVWCFMCGFQHNNPFEILCPNCERNMDVEVQL